MKIWCETCGGKRKIYLDDGCWNIPQLMNCPRCDGKGYTKLEGLQEYIECMEIENCLILNGLYPEITYSEGCVDIVLYEKQHEKKYVAINNGVICGETKLEALRNAKRCANV